MTKLFKTFIGVACAATMILGTVGVAACSQDEDNNDSSEVAGTYTISFTTSEISGNVRHTGYLTAMEATETNTLVLKSDGTYEYTKYVTSNRDTSETADVSSATVYSLMSLADYNISAYASDKALLTWESAGDGACSLVFYADGTFSFTYSTYGVTENGTWIWQNWTMTLTLSDGTEIIATMDSDYALNIHYVAVAGAGALYHDFILSSSIWGAVLGSSGNYTPTESDDSKQDDKVVVSYYYFGEGQKSTEYNGSVVTYDVTVRLFLLSNGVAYVIESTDSNSNVIIGSWTETNGIISVTASDVTTSEEDGKIGIDEIEVSYVETIPDEYVDADWEELITDAETTTSSGPIIITYVFTGTYTADGTKITLNPATSCIWSEDWGVLQAQGFTNCSGDENDIVYPKGEGGSEYYLPLDHFGGQYYYAPTSPENNAVTNNIAVTVVIDISNGSFVYSAESVFD